LIRSTSSHRRPQLADLETLRSRETGEIRGFVPEHFEFGHVAINHEQQDADEIPARVTTVRVDHDCLLNGSGG
jgi:hypothetical protein